MTDVIFTDQDRDLQVLFDTQVPPQDAIDLLERTIWGQRGLVYRSLDIAEMLSSLAEPSFLRLVRGRRTLAVAVRNRNTLEMAETRYDAIHEALFAVDREFTRQGLGTVLKRASREHYLGMLHAPGLLYGYIESGNEASLRLNRNLGCHELGIIRSRSFNRVRPKLSDRVQLLGADAASEMRALLKTMYRNHALSSFDHSLDAKRYFVVRQAGEIVAGVQAEFLHWELMKLPGWQGQLALRLLPQIPFWGRGFIPSSLHFARVGNLYAVEGAEPLISEIIETILAERCLPFAAVLADPRGAPERRIIDRIKFGPLDRLIGGSFHVLAEFKGVSEHDVAAISRAPVIISPKDPL